MKAKFRFVLCCLISLFCPALVLAESGQLQIRGDKGQTLGVCPLKHTAVTATISGFVARVDVEQQFVNPTREPIEAVYTFPLPDDAAVDAMTMIIGTRKIVGQIKRREEAQQIYQAAKSAGKKAALLDQERPNIFNQAVANIRPGENVTVKISYVNLLKYDNGSYQWTFPLVVGPRHITGGGGYYEKGKRGAPPPGQKEARRPVKPMPNASRRRLQSIAPVTMFRCVCK